MGQRACREGVCEEIEAIWVSRRRGVLAFPRNFHFRDRRGSSEGWQSGVFWIMVRDTYGLSQCRSPMATGELHWYPAACSFGEGASGGICAFVIGALARTILLFHVEEEFPAAQQLRLLNFSVFHVENRDEYGVRFLHGYRRAPRISRECSRSSDCAPVQPIV